jgi:hypothetical protein
MQPGSPLPSSAVTCRSFYFRWPDWHVSDGDLFSFVLILTVILLTVIQLIATYIFMGLQEGQATTAQLRRLPDVHKKSGRTAHRYTCT